MDQQPDTKHCPMCDHDLPVGDFGICRARRDERNLYCKSCIRQKVSKSRRALKEYKATRRRFLEHVDVSLFEMGSGCSEHSTEKSVVDKVREAINLGCRTQREIGQETKLGVDEIGDALTSLLLWAHEIRTQLVGEVRYYFPVEQKALPEVPELPKRKPNVRAFNSLLAELGPIRKRA